MFASRPIRALAIMAIAVGLSLGSAPTASAAVPVSPIQVGFANITNLTINGEATTTAVVDPGENVAISATVYDDHAGYCPGCIDNVPIGLRGAPSPAGCLEEGGHTGGTYTNTVSLQAPTTPGVYDVVAQADYTYYCAQNWGGQGTTIATIMVKATSDQICALAETYAADSGVGTALCAKLAAAQRAMDRGQTRTATNVMHAFENQVSAQTGKSLTSEQAATLMMFAAAL